ncbi:uncharacterized protein M421DRAFT_415253 [Didymella exigua CBS 183.55]|uniref:Uncharacterized protein n=1 Tax=Didymella exigua CBS 183.55 TaxID=1150837 RepID=A0A6A5S4D6_9PLEO|nr:uncharacterized protein M421DRAFT_415253 [Didymella exigua CBS 183.55]KAF1934208.1 hypothetical protein M421DRAFT_415253 [Didymella exigua CBS 183.55]
MAAATSATVTVDPPAMKKRGRPRKAVDENAVAPEMPAARKVSTKAKAAPKATSKAKTMDALKKKKEALTKVSDYKTKTKTPARKAAPAKIAEQATPATPTGSKILDEVKAARAFSKPPTEPQEPFLPPVPGPAPVAPILPAAAETPVGADAAPTQVPETHYEPPSSSSATGAPIQQPVNEAPSKPFIAPTTAAPSERANTTPPKPRATTIPLPRNPLTAPSPYSDLPKPRTAFAEPAPRAPPRAPRFPTRIIEPMPNTKLPPKYKKAARQVTSIIVGIPIIIVVGYELYGRWKTQINTKFEERERRRVGSKSLSVVGEK